MLTKTRSAYVTGLGTPKTTTPTPLPVTTHDVLQAVLALAGLSVSTCPPDLYSQIFSSASDCADALNQSMDARE